MAKAVFAFFIVVCLISVNAFIEFEIPRNAFDTDLYENVLDEELCEEQLSYIVNNNSMLRAEFLDAGLRLPRGILKGNFMDFGNYHQCLEINADYQPSSIEGKYCMIHVPFTQPDFEMPTLPEWPEEWPEWPEEWPEFPWPELLPNTKQHRELMTNIQSVQAQTKRYNQLIGTDMDLMRVAEDSDMAGQSFRLAVCVPKTCTTKQAINSLYGNTTAVGLEFSDDFCRLKNDKPFVPGDYAAMAIFGFIILITLLCTCYDLYYSLILKGDPKRASALGKSFSLYTNTRRLLTFNSAPGALECLDGIRALAMMWVIIGHTYSTQLNAPFYNRLDFFSWMFSFSSLWIMSAPITVDTFFLLSGLLIVYTSVGKMSQMGLIRNVHLYYLNRLLRMFPVLAAGVLLQATLFNHLSDGPQWNDIVAHKVHKCRRFWWPTLLHIQNYVTPRNQCIGPTWYLAVDVQLHILSPLILFWVLGKKKSAWIALTLAMWVSLTASTVYNYLMEFQPAPVIPARPPQDQITYMQHYYVNTLTRCTPFFVGMLYGYLLNVYKGKQINMPKYFVALGWISAFLVSAGIIYSTHPILQSDWYSPFLDGVINSFSRPGWAACLGWMIFACTHGYGGPINWFLSLRMWKLPARISFAMYIFHYPLMHVVNATSVGPTYFSVSAYFFRFLADITTALLVGFVVTVVIDSPFSTLIKLLMGGVLDSGLRTPRGILKGNLVDYGNYHECIDISENFESTAIEGKYCMINIPMVQDDFELPTLPEWPEEWPEWPEEWPEFPWPELIPNTKQHREMARNIKTVQAQTKHYSQMFGTDTDLIRVTEDNLLASESFKLAVCLPKSCTTKQAIDTLLINTTAVGLEFTDEFCRLKNDKPFVPGDYAAMGVFGFIILITILCTGYDLYYSHILKGDPKKASTLGKSFSVYNNTRRLLTFNSAPGALECLDGIRALAITWVIIGHTYSTQLYAPFYNRIDFFSWMTSLSAIWIMAAPITVDTFFLLSGLLIVYTSVGKMTKMRLVTNIHLYYLHRLLRMFPVLAAGVFLQATLFNHLSDGPRWNEVMAYKVHKCRQFWWPTLLHIQNYVTPRHQCIGPTWYLAVDVQLHILSPLILFWVLGRRKPAWIALTLAMIATLAATTTYNYINEFQPAPFVPTRTDEDYIHYMVNYYMNTLTRCTPFFVGLLVGYFLSVYKGKNLVMPKMLVVFGWLCALVVSSGIIYSTYPILQMDWESPFLDGVINSFSRPGWAACLGWMIFACTHGYGGPINWFLSLRMWKLPARISFAMYIFHYPIMHVVNASAVAPTYFSVIGYFYRFLSDISSSLLIGFAVTVLIDSPFSTLVKLAMGGGVKKPRHEKLVPKEEVNGVVNGEAGVINPAFAPEYEKYIGKTRL